jgi:hypothetical protein
MTAKYKIVIKRDFGPGKGYWMEGAGDVGTGKFGFVKSGFVVTKGGCNAVPGAGWFRTIKDAMLGIEVMEMTGDNQKFHEVYKAMKSARA